MSSPELRVIAAARARLGLVAFLIALAAVAWWSTVRAMSGMGASPGTDLGTLGWFIGIWVVMMAAMMLPAVSPTVALYARMAARRSPGLPLAFTAGYLVVWGAAGGPAAAGSPAASSSLPPSTS
jgi:predicted metal-binding membrane protein